MSKDYFELLGLPVCFAIDDKQLRDVYLRIQRVCHPDALAHKGSAERVAALQMSADMNGAYLTLKDPLKRAEYLLLLQGVKIGAEQGAVKPSQSLLMESMELREALMEAKDNANINALRAAAEEKLVQYQTQFSEDYDQKNLAKAVQAAIGWRLTAKFMSEISAKEKSIAA
jgi:molecular chaperone HscB